MQRTSSTTTSAAERLPQQLMTVLRAQSMTVEQLATYYSIKYGQVLSEVVRTTTTPPTKDATTAKAVTIRTYLESLTDFFEFQGDRVRVKEGGQKAASPWKRSTPKHPVEEKAEEEAEKKEFPQKDSNNAALKPSAAKKPAGSSVIPEEIRVFLRESGMPAIPEEPISPQAATSPVAAGKKEAVFFTPVVGEKEVPVVEEPKAPAKKPDEDDAASSSADTEGTDKVRPRWADMVEDEDWDSDQDLLEIATTRCTTPPPATQKESAANATRDPAPPAMDFDFVVSELAQLLIGTGHPVAHSSVLSSQFMHKHGVSVTDCSKMRPVDVFKKSDTFLWLGSGNVALVKDEHLPSVKEQLRLLTDRPKEARVKEAQLEASLPVPDVVTEKDVVEYFQRLILNTGGGSVYISALCGRFMQRFKRPVTAVVGCKPVDFFKRHAAEFLVEMGGHVRLNGPAPAHLLEPPASPEMIPAAEKTEKKQAEKSVGALAKKSTVTVAPPEGFRLPAARKAATTTTATPAGVVVPPKPRPWAATETATAQKKMPATAVLPWSPQAVVKETRKEEKKEETVVVVEPEKKGLLPSWLTSAPWRSRSAASSPGQASTKPPSGCSTPPSSPPQSSCGFATPPQTPVTPGKAELSFEDAHEHSALWKGAKVGGFSTPLHRFCETLARRCCSSFEVTGMVLDARTEDESPEEAELVLFAGDVPLDRHRTWMPKILKSIAERLQAALEDEATEVRREGSHLACMVTETGTDLRIFVSPTYPSPEKLREVLRAAPAKDRVFFQPAFLEERTQFLEENLSSSGQGKSSSAGLAQSAKEFLISWSAKQLWSSKFSTPPNYLLTLIAIYAAKLYEEEAGLNLAGEGGGSVWAKGLRGRVLKVCAEFESLHLVRWPEFGMRSAGYAIADIPKEILDAQPPLVLDPVNCSHNVADPSSFDGSELAETAMRALGGNRD